MSKPLVSILVTSYNQRPFLIEALESALAQTYRPLEIVVVDDGSEDGSRELICAYGDRYPSLVKPVLLESNGGVSRARNAALQASTGEWITTLDGDDRYLPRKVEREMTALMARRTVGVAYSNFHWIDAEGRRVGTWAGPGDILPSGFILHDMMTCRFPKEHWCRSEMMPRCALEGEMNDPRMPPYEDLDLKIKLSARFDFVGCAEPSHEYRRHGSGLSSANHLVFFESLRRVWEKNRRWARQLDRTQCRGTLGYWRQLLTGHLVAAACGEIGEGRNIKALSLLMRAASIDPRRIPGRLFIRCLVPLGRKKGNS